MNISDITVFIIFWFLIGGFAHFLCFGDIFDGSTTRKTIVSTIFGGPIFLAYFVMDRIIHFLDDFRNK